MRRAAPPRPSRPALCHPERPHSCKGLCAPCYQRAYRHGVMATCRHPGRPPRKMFYNGVCRECWSTAQVTARLDAPPAAPTRTVGYFLTHVPERCPKCGNRLLLIEGRRVSCRYGCGGDYYLVTPRDEPLVTTP